MDPRGPKFEGACVGCVVGGGEIKHKRRHKTGKFLWPTLASFPFIFSLFKTNYTIFTTNQCEKCPNVQYIAPGLEPMTS